MRIAVKQLILSAHAGNEKLWRVWWLWGMPVGWTVSGLLVFAEILRVAGYAGCADLFDVVRLLVYFYWARLAWRCSRNVRAATGRASAER